MKQMFELDFSLYVDGVAFGIVWLRPSDLTDLEKIGRAVSGLTRYRSKTRPNAVYVRRSA
jgi:hypothetical protein